MSFADLKVRANSVRKEVIEVCTRNGAGHIAPSLSTVDLLVYLYYSLMQLSDNESGTMRDRLIFSKAHGGYALYSILATLKRIPMKEWLTFYKGSCLAGCSERNTDYGIESGCGSLGHGLPVATGIAYGAILQNLSFRTFCIVGDGEMQEGSNWEAIQFAVMYELKNLFLIIDANSLQAMDFLGNVLTRKERENDLEIKLKAFGFDVEIVMGHDMEKIHNGFTNLIENLENGKPKALIAKTVKGYGLKCMENIPKFHFRIPTQQELEEGYTFE